MGLVNSLLLVCGWVDGAGWGGEVGARESLNENSSKREVFRLFIFRIVSPFSDKLVLFY